MKKFLSILLVIGIILFSSGAAYALDKANIDTQVGFAVANQNLDSYEDFQLQTTNIALGYKLAEQLTPYVILGSTAVDYNDFGDIAFSYGFGVKGILANVKGIDLNYNINKVAFQAEDQGTDFDYSSWNTILSVSKVFNINDLSKGYLKSVTPSVGYKFSNIATVKQVNGIESDQINNLNSLVFGADLALNDNLSIGATGSVFDEQSIATRVSYRF